MQAAERPFPVIKVVSGAVKDLREYQRLSPKSELIIRGSGDVDNLPTEHLEDFRPDENSARGRADKAEILSRGRRMMELNREHLGEAMLVASRVEVCNEPDPPGTENDPGLGYRNLGWLLHGAAAWRDEKYPQMKLMMPAFNAGTPTWAKIKAFVETGIVKRMQAAGDWLAFHEGVFGDDMPVNSGFPFDFASEGGLSYPNVGALCFRYRQMLYYLRSRGEAVPLVISEFYAGGGHQPSQVADIVQRFAWYDAGCQADSPWVKAILPFTVGTQAGWWKESAYEGIYLAPGGFMDYAKNQPHNTKRLRAKVNANVRLGPIAGRANPIVLTAVYAGTIFPTAQETNGDWLRVTDRGWVSKSVVEEID